MDDIIAEHSHWDTRTNNKGQQVVKWTTKNGWTVARPLDHMYKERTKTSTPDKMPSKRTKPH